jgi:hypothetical protein
LKDYNRRQFLAAGGAIAGALITGSGIALAKPDDPGDKEDGVPGKATKTRSVTLPEILSNPGFEGSYSGIAPSWSNTNYGAAAVTYTRQTTNVHEGSSAQKIACTGTVGDNDNGLIFFQEFTAQAGITYAGSVWLRADTPTWVQFGIRRVEAFFEFSAVVSLLVDTNWQRIAVQGGFEETIQAMFAIDFRQTGVIYVDHASLTIHHASGQSQVVASTAVIPDRLFGMHINNSLAIWSTNSEFEVSRLWDTGTRWRDIEPSNGSYSWSQLDTYVSKAVVAGQQSIYTLGITPSWANGGDQTLPPSNLANWIDYVQQVGNRYDGDITYWEVWNEVDTGNFWTGTQAEMLALAEIAYDELKAINPANQILTPNVTSNGLKWLDQYLHQGGAHFADIISFHRGFDTTLHVELFEPLFRGLINLATNYGLTSYPIFNTEAQVLLQGTSDQQVGAVSRIFLLMWLWGLSNLNWYAWDIYDDGGTTFYVPLSESSDKTTLTVAGTGYRETGRWLKGAQTITVSTNSSASWILELGRSGGYHGYVVWNPYGNTSFEIPAGWNITRKRDLAANTSGQGAGIVTVGYKPLLFENQAP